MPKLKEAISPGANRIIHSYITHVKANVSRRKCKRSCYERRDKIANKVANMCISICICEGYRQCKRGCAGGRGNPCGFCLLHRSSEIYRRCAISGHRQAFARRSVDVEIAATSTTSESLESNAIDAEILAVANRPRSTRGSQK